jgi:hypothetical protein
MGLVPRLGLTVRNIKDFGARESSMALDGYGIRTASCMRASGLRAVRVAMGYSRTLMGQSTSENGRTTYSMERGSNFGQMARSMTASTRKGQKVGTGH